MSEPALQTPAPAPLPPPDRDKPKRRGNMFLAALFGLTVILAPICAVHVIWSNDWRILFTDLLLAATTGMLFQASRGWDET